MHTQQISGQQGQQNSQTALREQEMFTVMLNLLKNSAREYATAVTEANCPTVRQTMQNLLNETLIEQADCYQIMSRQGWYPPASTATRQDVHQAVQTHRQAIPQLMQIAGQTDSYGHAGIRGNQPPQQQWRNQGQPQQWQQGNQPSQPQQWQSSAGGQGAWQGGQGTTHVQAQHPSQSQQWNADPGQAAWQTTGQAGQIPAYDSQAWRYGARQHNGEITQ